MNVFKKIYRALSGEQAGSSSSVKSAARRGYTQLIAIDERPLAVAAVYRCVKLISESVANLPMQYMRQKNDRFVIDDSNNLQYLLSVQPDGNMSAFDFWVQVVQNLLLDGNAYIVPIFDYNTMKWARLVLCAKGTVMYDSTNDTYTVSDPINKISGVYKEEEMIHLKNISLDGKNGISVLAYARQTLDIASTGDKETLNRFANGGNVRGIISNDKSVQGFGEYQDEELEKAAMDVDDKFSSGAHIVSVPGQVDFKQISLSSTDMQFLESRKFTVREICRFFGVHPSFVFDDTSNNYKSAEMANVAFLSNTLNPILRKIETELLRKLVPQALYAKRKFLFDREWLYACDLASRIDYLSKSLSSGLVTINELRAKENKQPIAGGDTVLVSANLKTISQIKEEANKNVKEQL